MKASVRTILTVTLYFIFLALAFLANSSCATGPRKIPPMSAPDVWELLDSNRAYKGTCNEITYIVATDPEVGEHTRNAAFFWNMVAGQKLLEYGGVVPLEDVSWQSPFFSVNKATDSIVDIWEERAKKEHEKKCGDCQEATPGRCPVCDKKPYKILGHAKQVPVDRLTGIHVGGTLVANPPPPKTGRTMTCAIGGRSFYGDFEEHKHLLETVIIHEVGHLIGLSDTIDKDGGIMGKITHESNFYQNLSPTTIAEMSFLYGESDYE